MLSSDDGGLPLTKKELKCRQLIEAYQEHLRSPRFLDYSMLFSAEV
jgi:hypothetical protein